MAPYEIRSFLPIWAVGSILGPTQKVDMRSMKKTGVVRLMVAVLDADIVVHDCLYEIFFKVDHIVPGNGGELDDFDEEDDLDLENQDKDTDQPIRRWKTLTKTKIVVFFDYFKRGFNVPLHWFLLYLLRYYAAQVHHLTPNGVLFLSVFISFCENSVGMELHWAFFHQSFVVRPQSQMTRTGRQPGVR